MMHGRSIALLLLVWCLPALADLRAEPKRPTDLTGSWVLNAAISDDAAQMLDDRLEEERRRYERWRRDMERNRPPGTPEDLDDSQPPPAARANRGPRPWQLRREENLKKMLAISPTLRITQNGTLVDIVTSVDSRRVEAGTHTQVSMPEGELADSEVGWDGEWLVIDRRVRNGPRALEKFRLLPKTGQLEYLMVWRGDTELAGMKIRRVYDRGVASSGPADPAHGPIR
jgi:hypothetical protein